LARQSLNNFVPQPADSIQTPAETAVRLDPNLAEAHAALAGAHLRVWDWVGADTAFRRANELNPDSVDVCSCYGTFLSAMGRLPEALAIAEHGAKVNPMSSEMHVSYAAVALMARRYQDAIAHAQRAAELEPQNRLAQIFLARGYQQIGKPDDAVLILDTPAFRGSPYLAEAYAMSGRRDEASKIISALTRAGAAQTRWRSREPISDSAIENRASNGLRRQWIAANRF
jgi:tetratricopeptide (TPR) repeat protein